MPTAMMRLSTPLRSSTPTSRSRRRDGWRVLVRTAIALIFAAAFSVDASANRVHAANGTDEGNCPSELVAPIHPNSGLAYAVSDEDDEPEPRPDGQPLPPSTPETASTAGESDPAIPPVLTEIERSLFDAANRDRISTGLPALTVDPTLIPIARLRAGDQVSRTVLSHLDDSGALGFVRLIQHARIPYAYAGENLVRLTVTLPLETAGTRAERALMQSATHRANILDPRYGRLAVGLATDANGRLVFAQLFRDGQ